MVDQHEDSMRASEVVRAAFPPSFWFLGLLFCVLVIMAVTADRAYGSSALLNLTESSITNVAQRSLNGAKSKDTGAGVDRATVSKALGRTVNVGSAPELIAAIGAAQPDDTIILAPGRYPIGQNLIDVVSAGRADQPITVTAESLGEVFIEWAGKTVEGFRIAAPFWHFENLDIRGVCERHDQCEHGFHIVGNSHGTVIRHNRVHEFNAMIKGNGIVIEGRRVFPNDVLIENNRFFNQAPRETGRPVTLIDVVGGQRWIIRGNTIYDFAKKFGDSISYAAFLKGNSSHGIFEQNLVICEMFHQGGIRVGVSLGGGGTEKQYCFDGDCSREHSNGIIRNNVIMNCPEDVGIYLNRAWNTKLYNNTLIDTVGIDVNFATSTADIRNNLVTGRIRDRYGGLSTRHANKTHAGPRQLSQWYVSPSTRDFKLRDEFDLVDKGTPVPEVQDDFCGTPRDAKKPDIGAFEYEAKNLKPACDIAEKVAFPGHD